MVFDAWLPYSVGFSVERLFLRFFLLTFYRYSTTSPPPAVRKLLIAYKMLYSFTAFTAVFAPCSNWAKTFAFIQSQMQLILHEANCSQNQKIAGFQHSLHKKKYKTNVWQSHQAFLPYICLLFSGSFLQMPAIHRAFWPTALKLFCTSTNFDMFLLVFYMMMNLIYDNLCWYMLIWN